MVSLEDRSTYLFYVEDRPKLKAFYDLIYGTPVVCPSYDEQNETDKIYYDAISAVQAGNQNKFDKVYSLISKRKPTHDSPSPFVHDDFLILVLILGVLLFQLDKEWIQNVINIRNRNAISITLDNLLNKNYKSKSNVPEVVVAFLSVFDLSCIDSELLDEGYDSIKANSELFESQDDISILSAIRAFDLIVELKIAPNGGEIRFLKKFEHSFRNRVGFISVILYNLVLLAIIYGLVQLIPLLPKTTKDQLNVFNLVIGIVGVGGLIGGNLVKKIRLKFKELVYLILGYNFNKIEKIRSKDDDHHR